MIDLKTYFINHFDSGRISDDKIRRFTEIHLKQLAAEDETGRYSGLLAATKDAYDAYFGSMSIEDIRFAVQQSLTKKMNRIFEEFKMTVSQKEGIVRGTFGKDSPVYEEFFPEGLSEYSNATLNNVERLMRRIIQATGKYAEELGCELNKQFTDIRDRFVAARSAQLEKFGEVREYKERTAQSRDELEEQLMKNVLTLAIDHVGRPQAMSRYFDQTVL